MIGSFHNFVHGTTAQMSWYVEIITCIGHKKRTEIPQGFRFKVKLCAKFPLGHSLRIHFCNHCWPHTRLAPGQFSHILQNYTTPDSKVRGANMGPIWVLLAPDGPHVGPMNLVIRVVSGLRLVNSFRPFWSHHRSSDFILCSIIHYYGLTRL